MVVRGEITKNHGFAASSRCLPETPTPPQRPLPQRIRLRKCQGAVAQDLVVRGDIKKPWLHGCLALPTRNTAHRSGQPAWRVWPKGEFVTTGRRAGRAVIGRRVNNRTEEKRAVPSELDLDAIAMGPRRHRNGRGERCDVNGTRKSHEVI